MAYAPVYAVTCGAFDLLHSGHIEFLEWCKKQCDHLTVVVIPDWAIIENKGRAPIYDADRRSFALEKLGLADFVTIDSEKEQFSSIPKEVSLALLGPDQRVTKMLSEKFEILKCPLVKMQSSSSIRNQVEARALQDEESQIVFAFSRLLSAPRGRKKDFRK